MKEQNGNGQRQNRRFGVPAVVSKKWGRGVPDLFANKLVVIGRS